MQGQRRKKKKAPQGKRTVEVIRGLNGFGFTIYGQQPCILSSIVPSSPADQVGLKAGNFLISVDNVNVMKCPHDTIVQLIGNSFGSIRLTVADHFYADSSDEECFVNTKQLNRSRHRNGVGNKSKTRIRNSDTRMVHHQGSKSCDRIESSRRYCMPSTSQYDENMCHQPSTSQHYTPNTIPLIGKESALECKVIVGYLGTIEMPKQIANNSKLLTVKSCVRKLRQEKRLPTTVLMTVLPTSLTLRNTNRNLIAEYPSRRISYASCSSENDYRYFGLVTSTTHINSNEDLDYTEDCESDAITVEISNSCHVFAIDPKLIEHNAHISKAKEFHISCSKDMITNTCLEFPASAEYIVNIIKMMYSIKVSSNNKNLDISMLALKSSPGNVPRNLNRVGAMRHNRRRDEYANERNNLPANSPQPSNHSEVTTASSNSDSGIGFHNDCQNISDRILVVDFPNVARHTEQRQHNYYNVDNGYLANNYPVVDAFNGRERPLNYADDVLLNINDANSAYSGYMNDVQPRNSKSVDRLNVRAFNERSMDSAHRVNHIVDDSSTTYSSVSQKRGSHYDAVYTENDEHHYEIIKPLQKNAEYNIKDAIIYSELNENKSDTHANNISIDDISVYSTHSHDYLLKKSNFYKNIQSSVDNILILGQKSDEHTFLHPSSVKIKLRKNLTPLLSKTRQLLSKSKRDIISDYKLSPKVFDVSRPCVSANNLFECGADAEGKGWRGPGRVEEARSVPDLRLTEACDESEGDQNSSLRRWAVGGNGGNTYRRPSSYVDHDMYSKPRLVVSPPSNNNERTGTSVASWSLGLDQLLKDPYGTAAFTDFLTKEFAAENIKFWHACERYKTGGNANMAAEIWSKHLAEGAPEAVNVDSQARNAVSERLQEAPRDLFDQVQKQIFNLMKFDSYPRFLRSPQHAACARAELTSAELPFQPERSPSGGSANKLKKSASNVEERRRSSLLHWSKRSASRERSNTSPSDREDKSTNVTTTQSNQGSLTHLCYLCRIILPDGATTVVQVDESQTVKQFIERLLDRRAIHCPDYDVILQGARQNVLKPNESSQKLAGREARVERKVLFRLELGTSRCLAVRCRPDKLLSEVLSKMLPPMATVMRDGRVLPEDAVAQHVEGAKLQVVLPTSTETNTLTGTQAKTCSTLDEITNKVFEEVLQGKIETYIPPSECSLKSEITSNVGSEARAVVAKLRAGVNVLNAVSLAPDSPTRVDPPAPAPRTSLGSIQNNCKPQPAQRTTIPVKKCDVEITKSEPPPLPPKPKVLPLKPSNWANHEKDIIGEDNKLRNNRLAFLDAAASSLV